MLLYFTFWYTFGRLQGRIPRWPWVAASGISLIDWPFQLVVLGMSPAGSYVADCWTPLFSLQCSLLSVVHLAQWRDICQACA